MNKRMNTNTFSENSTTELDVEAQKAFSQKIKAGDREAFTAFIRMSQRPLYGLIWKMLRNHADTDDILQETYLKLFEKRDRLNTDRPIFPYARKIAVNLTLTRLKSRTREVGLEEHVDIPANETPAQKESDNQETLALARKAIEQLPDDQKLVIQLRLQDELSYKEIANTLNMRIGTVMSRLARAREKIAAYIHKENQPYKNEFSPS